MELLNLMTGGNSSIEFIRQKLELLYLCEDFPTDFSSKIDNHYKNVSRTCIAVIALIIRPEDLNAVMCLFCGVCPKVVNRNGSYIDNAAISY